MWRPTCCRATHFLQLQNVTDLADALGAFFDRHPL